MPLFNRPQSKRAAQPQRESESTKSISSWEDVASPAPSPQNQPSPALNTSWDSSAFPETSNHYPSERNGNWLTATAEAIQDPSTTASTINTALQWPRVRMKITQVADSASDSIQQSLNRAFQGHDVPAMHDKVMDMVPSISIPTPQQVSQSVDSLTDRAQAILPRRPGTFVDESLPGDHLAFAHQMGRKVCRALVRQGICKQWQVDATRGTVQWQARLHDSLVQFFQREKSSFGVKQLFDMTPVWTGDGETKMWKLGLDTGIVEVVIENQDAEGEEKRIVLPVDFALSESVGSVKVEDIERRVVAEEDWMAVQ